MPQSVCSFIKLALLGPYPEDMPTSLLFFVLRSQLHTLLIEMMRKIQNGMIPKVNHLSNAIL